MPSSGASWRTRGHHRAAPLDKEEPRTQSQGEVRRIYLLRTRVNEPPRTDPRGLIRQLSTRVSGPD